MATTETHWFNVSMHRRIELFSVGLLVFSALAFIPLSILITFYILYAGNIYLKTIFLLYLVFVYNDRHTGDCGGRGAGITWVRSWTLWKHCINYFPLNLVKTADLSPDKNYLICFFPHGVLSFGALITFITNHSKWSTLFPGVRPKTTTLTQNLLFPIARELLLSLGICSASANSLTTLMEQSNDPKDQSNHDGYTSNAAGLIVGGAEESFYALPNTYKFVLRNRKGFVKIALKTGASLVPAISFGENNVYDIVKHKDGSWARLFQCTFKRFTRIAPVLFNGRGYFQYNVGFIPKRLPVTTVIGAPIHLKKTLNPTSGEIDKVHQVFCTQITELFEAHKGKYLDNSDHIQLEII